MDRDDRDRARARARDAPVDDAEPPDAYGGETWAAFLREAGVDAAHTDHSAHTAHTAAGPPSAMALPSSSASSAPSAPSAPADASSSSTSTSTSTSSVERKRRLAAAHSPTRRPSSVRAPSSSQPGSNANPIVLDASPAPRDRPLPPPPSYSAPSQPPRPFRRESDLVLPPWQPDTDVTRCPVCSRHFTFLFRKHHCRKCGRVVCSQCSPHRITIPRQFIVHPPNDVAHNIIDLTGDHDNNPLSNFGPFRNPALGGGEEVRVCNPCVPDPNYSLPPQYPSRDAFRNRRVSHHDASRSGDRWPSPLTSPLPNPAHVYPSHSRQHERSSSSSHPPTGPSYTPQPNQHRAGPESGSARAAHMLPRPFFIPSAQPPSIQQLNPRPRRQIAEEDECPVCGGELPAKGPDGDDTARAQHVEECIALHSSSPAPSSTPRPQAQTSASLPVTRTRGMSSAGNGQGASSYRHSHAARGMFPYIATEKDCVDEDGQDAECVICFEEFQPGDKMARLVCWCKFHEKCIKDWWKMKGRGACPTHQLHEE